MVARVILVAAAVLALVPAAWAGEVELRDFVTVLDGRRVGDYQMKITQQDDGSVILSSQGQMQLNHPGGLGRYRYHGSEVWKDGRLLRLDSTSSDDRKQTTVSAAAEGDGARVVVDGQARVIPGPVWVTTYWRLPAAEVRGLTQTLLDADNGHDLRGKLERVGSGQVVVAGQPLSCMRYRLLGDVQVDLWYDAQDRLVRQEWGQDGHRVVLELIQVSH
jgi:hypothetical protein